MKLLLFTLVAVLSLASCASHAPEKVRSKNDSVASAVPAKPLSLRDSVIAYILPSATQDIVNYDSSSRYGVYSTRINNNDVAIVSLTDSTLYLLSKQAGRWIIKDSARGCDFLSAVTVQDINGDKINDLVAHAHPDIHGMSQCFLFIADKDGKLHCYHNHLKGWLFNVSFDTTTRLLKSYYMSCAYCTHLKELYGWQNDSLYHVSKAELDMNTFTIYRYRWENGKQILYKTVKDRNEKVWDTTLFQIQEF